MLGTIICVAIGVYLKQIVDHEIKESHDKGYREGYRDGYRKGYREGYQTGYETTLKDWGSVTVEKK